MQRRGPDCKAATEVSPREKNYRPGCLPPRRQHQLDIFLPSYKPLAFLRNLSNEPGRRRSYFNSVFHYPFGHPRRYSKVISASKTSACAEVIFMPFSATHASPTQAHLGSGSPSANVHSEFIVQSRETGDVVPAPKQSSIPEADDKDKAKPFAHFVAGGYVLNLFP